MQFEIKFGNTVTRTRVR